MLRFNLLELDTSTQRSHVLKKRVRNNYKDKGEYHYKPLDFGPIFCFVFKCLTQVKDANISGRSAHSSRAFIKTHTHTSTHRLVIISPLHDTRDACCGRK